MSDRVRGWAERQLPFLWDICKDLEDGSEWVCIPYIATFGEEIALVSRNLKEERIVRADDFTKKYEVLNLKGGLVYGR